MLEAALNIVLPSNGASWLKLRSDDFSELAEHYVERKDTSVVTPASHDGVPVISSTLMDIIKAMLASDPLARLSLDEMREMEVMRGLEALEARPALVEADQAEESAWIGVLEKK